jgi:murein DD-endopeptidase MepM/ murein hydrolase activator NlpD
MDGASTLSLTVLDDDLSLLRSDRLRKGAEIEIDGLFFRLCGVKKSGRQLTLVFEEREINLLRQRKYSKPKIALRANMTRAEFVLSLLNEVTETKIRYVIPELHKVQPVEKATDIGGTSNPTDRNTGFPPEATQPVSVDPTRHQNPGGNVGLGLTVKGVQITTSQLRNANAILVTGQGMSARRKVLVCSIMTAIQEATLNNLSGGDRDSVGLFQQRASWGSFRDRHDPVTAARLFFRPAIQVDKQQPNLGYSELCQAVQRSAFPNAYAQWRDEAERIVTAWGLPGGDHEGSMSDSNSSSSTPAQPQPYHFYRGVPPKKGKTAWGRENSWTCLTRLAQQVNWRAFEVAGAIYFIDEEDLFKSKAIMTITEETEGIDSIDFDYDENKESGNATVSCHIKRWKAPPGSVIKLFKLGPVNGRWLVSTVSRDLFSTDATIELKKPRPALPEPSKDDYSQQVGDGGKTTGDPQDGQYQVGTALVKPIPKPYFTSQGGLHQTAGLPGYEAIDFFAAPGSPVIAPEGGTIERFSGHPPSEGPPLGVGGPLGWSIYLRGESGSIYYMTHLDKRLVVVGQQVNIAQVIATVADYDKYAGKGFSHCHCGVHPGRVTIEMLGAAPAAVKAK